MVGVFGRLARVWFVAQSWLSVSWQPAWWVYLVDWLGSGLWLNVGCLSGMVGVSGRLARFWFVAQKLVVCQLAACMVGVCGRLARVWLGLKFGSLLWCQLAACMLGGSGNNWR